MKQEERIAMYKEEITSWREWNATHPSDEQFTWAQWRETIPRTLRVSCKHGLEPDGVKAKRHRALSTKQRSDKAAYMRQYRLKKKKQHAALAEVAARNLGEAVGQKHGEWYWRFYCPVCEMFHDTVDTVRWCMKQNKSSEGERYSAGNEQQSVFYE